MELESELRLGGHAGLGALLDMGLWLQLARRAFSPIVLLQMVVACALVILAGLVSLALTRWLVWLVPLGFALWLWPPVLRWFIGAVAKRAIGAAAQARGLAAQELPPVSAYRTWWRASMVCSLLLLPMAQLGLAENLPAILALFVAQIWFATPALVRSVLAPWFPQDRIDAALQSDLPRWAVLTAFWFVAYALLHWVLRSLMGFSGLDLGADAMAAWRGGHMVVFVLGHLLVLAVLTTGIGIFCAAAMARMAAERLLGAPDAAEAPDTHIGNTAAAADTQPAFERVREATRHAVGATRGMTIAVGVALAVVLLWPVVRKPLILGVLHVTPDSVGAQRNQMACDGKTSRLRMLHWAGIGPSGGAGDIALACAARNGHLATVKLLVDLGDAITAPVDDPRYKGSGTRLSPLLQALQSEQALPSLEYMLEHAPNVSIQQAAGHDTPDAVQAAAMSNCLACVDWAVRHHAPIDGTWQATPAALWLDNAGRGSHETANLQRLQALGLSVTAIGEDGRSALHAAANNGDLDAVNWLLAQGANPAQPDRDGNTPVLYAACRLGFARDGGWIGQDAGSDRERVQVVQRLIGVTPTLDHGWPNPMRHAVLSAITPYAGGPIDFETATHAYPELRDQNGGSLADLINPS